MRIMTSVFVFATALAHGCATVVTVETVPAAVTDVIATIAIVAAAIAVRGHDGGIFAGVTLRLVARVGVGEGRGSTPSCRCC
ncbi:hypothetical protein EDD21DRAFT_369860 [Dissophora ornata]|nr:hypothetical protein EDD21DRAFT_369860 [Dissophora ornata]